MFWKKKSLLGDWIVFKGLFEKQQFEKVIIEIEKELSFIDNKELVFDYELLKVASIGRLEGILNYEEELKNLLEKYPNTNRNKEIQKINNEINKKWESKNKKTFLGNTF